jgi:hypothetical protein
LREERKQSENSLGGYVQAVWSGAGPGRSHLGWDRRSGEAGRSIVLASVRGLGTVEQAEQVVSESVVVDEGGTVDSPGRRTGARDGGAGGAGRARVRRSRQRRAGLAGVCRTR